MKPGGAGWPVCSCGEWCHFVYVGNDLEHGSWWCRADTTHAISIRPRPPLSLMEPRRRPGGPVIAVAVETRPQDWAQPARAILEARHGISADGRRWLT